MPMSRQLLAVPFVGKDTPSIASEFAHPDVILGLTVLAYRYEGMRVTDFRHTLDDLQARMGSESGPPHKRPSWRQYTRWVHYAGGRVRGVRTGATKKRVEQ